MSENRPRRGADAWESGGCWLLVLGYVALITLAGLGMLVVLHPLFSRS